MRLRYFLIVVSIVLFRGIANDFVLPCSDVSCRVMAEQNCLEDNENLLVIDNKSVINQIKIKIRYKSSEVNFELNTPSEILNTCLQDIGEGWPLSVAKLHDNSSVILKGRAPPHAFA